MAMGIEGFRDELIQHFAGSGAPGAYERVGRAFAPLVETPEVVALLTSAWSGRRFDASYARPLLLIASLRYRALENPDHPIAPELLLDADAPDLEARVAEALRDPGLEPILAARSVQTNEPGRAWGWGLPALVLGLGHRKFALVDLGASAGLNLVVDRTAVPYRLGTSQVAGFDFPSPETRLGLDLEPVDITDPLAARWLRACIWPGQYDRLQRFEACQKVYANAWPGEAPRPVLLPHRLGAGETRFILEDVATRPGSDVVMAFESVVRPYLAPAAREAHDADLWAFLTGGTNRLWAVLEPSADPQRARSTNPMDLVVHFVRGGERVAILLGQSGYHASTCVIMPGAPEKLVEAWNRT